MTRAVKIGTALTALAISAIVTVLAITAGDSSVDAFVKRCMAVIGSPKSSCSCAADRVKAALGEDYWKVMTLTLKGDHDKAEIETLKLGIGGMFGLMARWSIAINIAERQCSIRGLSRM